MLANNVIVMNLPVKELDIIQFWNLKTIGITDPIQATNDDRAVDQFEKSIVRNDSAKYIVS